MITQKTATDAEMVRAVAAGIMGWSWEGYGAGFAWYRDRDQQAFPGWNPLEQEDACAQVLEALAAQFDVDVFSRLNLWRCVAFLRNTHTAVGNIWIDACTQAGYRRAIVLCAYDVVQTTAVEVS